MFGFEKKKVNMKWAELVLAQPIQHPERITEELLHKATERQVARRSEIIMESIEIIRKTKNEDTRQGRINLCKKHYDYFQQLLPYVDKSQKSLICQCEKAMMQVGIL